MKNQNEKSYETEIEQFKEFKTKIDAEKRDLKKMQKKENQKRKRDTEMLAKEDPSEDSNDDEIFEKLSPQERFVLEQIGKIISQPLRKS